MANLSGGLNGRPLYAIFIPSQQWERIRTGEMPIAAELWFMNGRDNHGDFYILTTDPDAFVEKLE